MPSSSWATLRAVLGVDVGDDDPVAAGRTRPGDGGTDPAAGTRDQRDPAVGHDATGCGVEQGRGEFGALGPARALERVDPLSSLVVAVQDVFVGEADAAVHLDRLLAGEHRGFPGRGFRCGAGHFGALVAGRDRPGRPRRQRARQAERREDVGDLVAHRLVGADDPAELLAGFGVRGSEIERGLPATPTASHASAAKARRRISGSRSRSPTRSPGVESSVSSPSGRSRSTVDSDRDLGRGDVDGVEPVGGHDDHALGQRQIGHQPLDAGEPAGGVGRRRPLLGRQQRRRVLRPGERHRLLGDQRRPGQARPSTRTAPAATRGRPPRKAPPRRGSPRGRASRARRAPARSALTPAPARAAGSVSASATTRSGGTLSTRKSRAASRSISCSAEKAKST